jgi:SPP1 gp7 family putative phage head morphogenesis protein
MLNVVQHALYRPHVARLRVRQGRRLRPIRVSRQAELWYLNRLLDAVSEMRTRAKTLLRVALVPQSGSGVHDASPWSKVLRDLAQDPAFNSLKDQAAGLARLAAKRALFWVDDRLAKEVSRSLGVDIRAVLSEHGPVVDKMREFTEWNVSLISTIPDRFLEDLEDKLSDAWASGLRAKAVAEIVDDVVEAAGDSGEANASLIARDQMNKMNSAFNQTRMREVGINRYQWRTSDDERVRPEHEEMETGGENGDGVYSWDEPGPLKGTIDGRPCHPGEDIQCRCDAIPVFDLEALEAEAAEIQGAM